MQGTPYERPESFGTRATLNDTEFAERQAARAKQVQADGEIYVPQGQRTGIGGPSHWSAGERGDPQRQASLVIDPPNGRIPAMTDEGKQRIDLARSTYYYDFPDAVVAHPFETFEGGGEEDRERERRLEPALSDYLNRRPCVITNFGSRSTSMCRSGSPRTAMTSAYLPDSIDPESLSASMVRAASSVMRRSTVIGSIPRTR
ncbi:MAG TPA: hypothetical protein VH762_15625, partial [Gemmatimonadaceae bacterium]